MATEIFGDITVQELTIWGLTKNGWHFADNNFKCIFLNEIVWILIKFLLKYVPKTSTDNKSTLLEIMVLYQQATSHYLKQYWPTVMSHMESQGHSVLTHWPLEGGWLQSQMSKFQTHFNDKYLKHFLWNCYHYNQVNATTPHWSLVNIGSCNGLVPSGNKPLPEPMLT